MPELEPVDESWTSALCVVAHPDDMEFGAAAAVARWTGQGKRVVFAMVTSGEAGIDGMSPEEARKVREAEQRASAAIVGVEVAGDVGAVQAASLDQAAAWRMDTRVALTSALAQGYRVAGFTRDTASGRAYYLLCRQ